MNKPIFALLALLSLLSLTPAMAETPPVVGATPDPVAAPAPGAAADFLATLTDGQPQTAEEQMPAPLSMTGCGNYPPCGSGQLCCYMCGAQPEGDDSFCWMCVTPERRGCPIVA